MTIEKQQQKIIQNIDSILNKKIITDEEIKTQLNDLVRDVENDFFMVVVLGEFKRGKSTFINSLLGANLLPTDVLPETAVISAIAYNDTPGVEAVYQDGTTEKNTLDAAYLNRFSANGPSNEYQNIKYLKINYPADILKNHLILVDTPGVDDLNEQRCDVTYNFIPKANVILFLLDAKSPLKETEMEFIEEHILPMELDNIIFLINKYDNVDDEEDEDYLAKVKNRIQSAFSKEHSNILKKLRIYPISAKWALKGIINHDKRFLDASGVIPVYNTIRQMAFDGDVELIKLKQWENRYNQLLQRQIHKLEGQKALQSANINTLQEAAKNLKNILNEHQLDSNIIEEFVNHEKKDIDSMIDKSIMYFYDRLNEDITDNVRFYKGLDFKDYVEQRISKQLKREMENWVAVYSPHINQLLNKLENEISKGISYKFNQRIILKVTGENQEISSSFSFHITAQDVSNATVQAGALTAGGAGLMMLIGGPAIMPFISMAAFPFLQRKFLENKLNIAKEEIIPDIQNQLFEAIAKLKKAIHDRVDFQCEQMVNNAKKAYEILLEDFSREIQRQIQEKENTNADLHDEITKISKQIRLLEQYIQ